MSQHDFDHQKKKLKYFPNLCFIARASDGKKIGFFSLPYYQSTE